MALQRLVLSDFVIVPRLELELGAGFSVLTGETGAGKSILIDALQLVLGARASGPVVREGASRCEVAAEFDLTPSVRAWLAEHGFAGDEGDADTPAEGLLLRRSVDNQGRSKAWINGSPATVGQLKALADALVDIHGQHAWQSLTRPDAVRQLLDAYAGLSTQALAAHWQAWRNAQRALQAATEQRSAHVQESERLQWQIDEVGKLAPNAGEWDEINVLHARLSNAQSLIDASQTALAALDADDAPNALQGLQRAMDALEPLQHLEPRFADALAALVGAQAQMQDACHTLQRGADDTELDPSTLQTLDERMALWLSLARRYRCTPDELPERWAQWKNQLTALDAANDIAALQQQASACEAAFKQVAQAISRQRAQAAKRLSQAITAAMQGLGMQGGRFEVRLTALEAPQAHGLEQVEFLVAGHPGSTPHPVGKVASGGELSRIALAISVTTSALGEAPTLIFDEVDAGVGGAVAQTVGRLMKQLGQDRQVLAVTHLPQVAACAHHHLLVSKSSDSAGTRSQVGLLAQDERITELARMLSGQPSDTSLAHAREMLAAAN